MAPPPRLRVDRAAAPGRSSVGLGPSGLRLEARGEGVCEGSPWARVEMVVAGPVPSHGMDAAQGGDLVVTWSPGLVRSVRTADAAQLFDRRPPGAERAVGAASANAGLVRDQAGWRAVVLPSLGDRLSDLGDGPVAISPDGLSVAVADGDGAVVVALADGAQTGRVDGGPVDALALGEGGAWVARGAAVGDASVERADGPGVRILRAAPAARAAVALHEDGSVTVARGDERHRFTPPVVADAVAISAAGDWVLASGEDRVVICRATDGAVAFDVQGARCGALAGDDRVVISGDWGLALVAPVASEG